MLTRPGSGKRNRKSLFNVNWLVFYVKIFFGMEIMLRNQGYSMLLYYTPDMSMVKVRMNGQNLLVIGHHLINPKAVDYNLRLKRRSCLELMVQIA
jgi:hypothetical protein